MTTIECVVPWQHGPRTLSSTHCIGPSLRFFRGSAKKVCHTQSGRLFCPNNCNYEPYAFTNQQNAPKGGQRPITDSPPHITRHFFVYMLQWVSGFFFAEMFNLFNDFFPRGKREEKNRLKFVSAVHVYFIRKALTFSL